MEFDPYNLETSKKDKYDKIKNANTIAYLQELTKSRGWGILIKNLNSNVETANDVINGTSKEFLIKDIKDLEIWQNRRKDILKLIELPEFLIQQLSGKIGSKIKF